MSIQRIKNKIDWGIKIYSTKVSKVKGPKQLNMVNWKNEANVLCIKFRKDVDLNTFETAKRAVFVDQSFITQTYVIDTMSIWNTKQSSENRKYRRRKSRLMEVIEEHMSENTVMIRLVFSRFFDICGNLGNVKEKPTRKTCFSREK